jgi:NADH dehydrogenase
MGRDGRLIVDEYLRLPAHHEVFVLGDCAWFPVADNDGRPAPPNAQTAVREARLVAKNVAASLHNEPLESYRYHNEGNLVSLGQGDGVALLGESVHLQGLPAWLVWRGYYLSQLMGFKNRIEVLVDWTAAYWGQRATSRLDVVPAPLAPLAPPPTAASEPASHTSGTPSPATTGGADSPAPAGARDGG